MRNLQDFDSMNEEKFSTVVLGSGKIKVVIMMESGVYIHLKCKAIEVYGRGDNRKLAFSDEQGDLIETDPGGKIIQAALSEIISIKAP